VAEIFAIIGRQRKRFLRPILAIMFASALLCIFGLRLIPYVYAAPALSGERLPIYESVLNFVKEHDEFKDFELDEFGRLIVGDRFYMLDSSGAESELGKIITNDNVIKLKKIYQGLHQSGCYKAFRASDVVFFMNRPSAYRPRRFGVVYSIDGRNPNDLEEDKIKKYRPFIKITGDWYMSRGLERSYRGLMPIPPPDTSLIDHSLQIGHVQRMMK
jgi:hypothetical protein